MTESAWRSGRRQIRCAARTRCRMRRCGPLSSPTRNRLAVLTLLLAGLTGCGQGQLPQGPLGSQPENHDTVGQPVLRGGADTIGFDGFYNGGTKPAVIDRLVIVSPATSSSPARTSPSADPSATGRPSPRPFPPPPGHGTTTDTPSGGGPDATRPPARSSRRTSRPGSPSAWQRQPPTAASSAPTCTTMSATLTTNGAATYGSS
jgi:hypothetical protein